MPFAPKPFCMILIFDMRSLIAYLSLGAMIGVQQEKGFDISACA